MRAATSSHTMLEARLQKLWLANQSTLVTRLEALETGFGSWLRTHKQSESLDKAQLAAHNLAGVLGTFGLMQAGRIASRLEELAIHPEQAEKDQIEAMLKELRYQILHHSC